MILSTWVVLRIGTIFSLDMIAASTAIVHTAHREKPGGAGA
ncbi:hypothetical protein ABZY09_21835 [Streptomyces sp. NPDC002928]